MMMMMMMMMMRPLQPLTSWHLAFWVSHPLQVVGPLRVGGGGAYQGFDFPPVLHHIYGQSAPKVRFCLTMREPISRTQSELYMIMRQGGLILAVFFVLYVCLCVVSF